MPAQHPLTHACVMHWFTLDNVLYLAQQEFIPNTGVVGLYFKFFLTLLACRSKVLDIVRTQYGFKVVCLKGA